MALLIVLLSLVIRLRSGGRYAVAGAIAGPLVELEVRTLYLKDLTLLGCTILDPKVFGNLVKRIENDEIKPLVDMRFRLKEIEAAQLAFLIKLTWLRLCLKLTYNC